MDRQRPGLLDRGAQSQKAAHATDGGRDGGVSGQRHDRETRGGASEDSKPATRRQYIGRGDADGGDDRPDGGNRWGSEGGSKFNPDACSI